MLSKPIVGVMEQSGAFLFPCFVIFVILRGTLPHLVEIPKNVAVQVGAKVTLSCSSNLSVNISWFSYDLQGNRSCVYNGQRINSDACPNCSLNHTLPTQWDIWFTANIAHAKLFECIEPWTTGSVKASVTVLDSEFRCSKNTADGVDNLTCGADFSGRWVPVIEWHELRGQETKFLIENASWISTIDAYHRLTSILVLNESDADQDRTYRAVLKFRVNERPKDVNAQNIPDYNSTWLYPTMEKEKGPEGTTWTPGIAIIVVFTLVIIVLIIAYLVKKKPWMKKNKLPASQATGVPPDALEEEDF